MTAAVARRTVLLAMPPLPIAATATLSPAAAFAEPDPLVALGRRIDRLEQAIDDLDDDEFDRGQVPLIAEIGRLVAAVVATRAGSTPGLRVKVDLLCDALERDIDRARELAASLALDLAALDAAGSG